MKPAAHSRRSDSSMILYRWIAVTFLCLGLGNGSAWSEQIQKKGSSRYETEQMSRSVKMTKFKNLSFTASSYLGGKLLIRSSKQPNTVVTYYKSFKAKSESQAEEFSDYIDIAFEEAEDEFAISAETISSPPWNGTDYSAHMNVEIELPEDENLKIYVRTSLFTIDVQGPFQSVDISNSFGEVSVAGITNKTKVFSENGMVSIKDCSGPTSVTTSYRPIELTNVDGKLGTIKLRNTNGKITLNSVRGEIDVRTDFATISGSELTLESGNSILSTENANIELDCSAVNGDLAIRNENGKVDLIIPNNTSANYNLQIEEGGRIYTKGIPIKTDLVTRTIVSGSSGSRQNKIEVDMSGVGTINLEGKSAEKTSGR